MSRPWALSVSNGSGAPWAADWTVLVVVSQGGQPRREWRSYSCLGLAQSRRVGCASTACRVSVDLVLASPEEGGARHALIWQYGGWLREPPLGAGLHGERPGWVVPLLSSPHLEWVHTQCAVGFALTTIIHVTRSSNGDDSLCRLLDWPHRLTSSSYKVRGIVAISGGRFETQTLNDARVFVLQTGVHATFMPRWQTLGGILFTSLHGSKTWSLLIVVACGCLVLC